MSHCGIISIKTQTRSARTVKSGLWALTALVTLSLTLAPSRSAQAQDVAVGQITATVQAVLAVTATNALAFGSVYQGVPKSIANNSASAAVFTIGGQGGSGVSMYLQLPAYLATATGDDRLVVAFGSTDASIDTTANSDPTTFGSGWQNQNPFSLPNGTVVGSPANQTALFLGGTVYPTVDQAAGAYTGDLILTVAYNGN